MNKKLLALFLVLAVMLLAPACKKKAAGQMNSEAMLAMVPEAPAALVGFNLQQLTSLEFFDKMLKEGVQKQAGAGKAFKDYADFKQQTGIDLQKDVFAAVVAVYGNFDSENPELAVIVNMKYDAAKLLAVLKDKQVIAAEESYRDLTLYTLKDDGEGKAQDMRLAFLNKANIALGSPVSVKKVVDLERKQGQNVLKTAALMKHVEPLNKKGLFWMVIGSIPGKMKESAGGGMMPVDLSKAEAFTLFADFRSQTLSGELRMVSRDEAGNKQIADMLNGLKALGAMGAAKEPELGQLLNGIQLTSAADHVKLTFSLTEELMNKLGAKAKDKAQSMAVPAPAEPTEEPFADLPQESTTE
ncbi:MAG: hypothetical protein MUF02_08040 [Acidobacteria bacterium]|jgi:hypothetical protein|nr:hypothetical protein [Acidobacteriota bacterium]